MTISHIDSDVMDDLLPDGRTVAQARKDLASEASARYLEEEQARQANVREMRARLKKVESQTDVDISDEAAGRMRAVLARESEARREEERAARVLQVRSERERLQRVVTVTDSDLMDEAAGMARLELASQSAKRRDDEAKRLARDNEALRARLRAARSVAKTDVDAYDDVIDEETGKTAGQLRAELKAASDGRRYQLAQQLGKTNLALRERLEAVQPRSQEDALSMRWGRLNRGRFAANHELAFGVAAKQEARRRQAEQRELRECAAEEARRADAEYAERVKAVEEEERRRKVAEAEALVLEGQLAKAEALARLHEGRPSVGTSAPAPAVAKAELDGAGISDRRRGGSSAASRHNDAAAARSGQGLQQDSPRSEIRRQLQAAEARARPHVARQGMPGF